MNNSIAVLNDQNPEDIGEQTLLALKNLLSRAYVLLNCAYTKVEQEMSDFKGQAKMCQWKVQSVTIVYKSYGKALEA